MLDFFQNSKDNLEIPPGADVVAVGIADRRFQRLEKGLDDVNRLAGTILRYLNTLASNIKKLEEDVKDKDTLLERKNTLLERKLDYLARALLDATGSRAAANFARSGD